MFPNLVNSQLKLLHDFIGLVIDGFGSVLLKTIAKRKEVKFPAAVVGSVARTMRKCAALQKTSSTPSIVSNIC